MWNEMNKLAVFCSQCEVKKSPKGRNGMKKSPKCEAGHARNARHNTPEMRGEERERRQCVK